MVQLKVYRLYIISLFICVLCYGGAIKAQTVSVDVKLDTTEFLIGEQVGLEIHVMQPKNVSVGLPIFKTEELDQKDIEIIEELTNDTSLVDDKNWLIKKRLIITSFNAGRYIFPPIPVLYYSDTIKSEPVLFTVNSIDIDTTQAIKDIKMPYSAPVSFAEVMPWVGGSVGLVLIILVLIYIIRKIIKKEPIIKRNKPKEPAHIIALRDLEKLKANKLWQKDRIKGYYTELTDILRMYLWNRYSIKTLERTSDEILNSLKKSEFENEDLFLILRDILKTSDLVKFAKFKPLANENEKYLKESFDFVEKTKLIEEVLEQKDDIESSKEKEVEENIENN